MRYVIAVLMLALVGCAGEYTPIRHNYSPSGWVPCMEAPQPPCIGEP